MGDMAVRGAGAVVEQNLAQRTGERRGSGVQKPDRAAAEAKPEDRDLWCAPVEEEKGQSLVEMMAQAKERAEQRRKVFQVKTNPRYGDACLEAYARLARARTQADVNAAAGYARRRIVQLKAALRQDGDHADKIRAAIGQLQKAVVRAGRKRNDLNREALAERRREKVEEEARQREAQRQRVELQRSRALRAIRERGYLQEAAIQNRLVGQMALAREQFQLPAQESACAASTSAAAAGGYAAATAPAADGATFSIQA